MPNDNIARPIVGAPHGQSPGPIAGWGMLTMVKTKLLAWAVFAASLAWATASEAEGALAVGIPGGDPRHGFTWRVRFDDRANPAFNGPTADAASAAMKSCRDSPYPKNAAACRLIATFRDQCVAVAANGAPNASVSAAGWAIASDSATATNRAIAECESMRRRKGGGPACHLDGDDAVLCDGKAK